MFCAGNTDADKDIIDMNNYLDEGNLIQNEDFTNKKNLNIEPMNLNIRKYLKN